MKKRNVVLVVVAALLLQLAMAGQVYAWVGCSTDVRFYPMEEGTLKYGAQGGMQYYPADCEFWFDFGAIGLESCQDYTLVCGDASDLICLGSGTTNEYGQIHIRDCINTGDLLDLNVALVLTEDVDCDDGYMIDLEPDRYLLGVDTVNYDDTCDVLGLVQKDPDSWDVVPCGANGQLIYDPSACMFDFDFLGQGLQPETSYTLIYYPDPWPGTGLICLGEAQTDPTGCIEICGSVETGDLPAPGDDNYPDGAKIWLVLSGDVDCVTQEMIGWNPTMYLFEEMLITYDDTCD
ncbi:MAG: hypothetical protein P8Z79_07585 [Sedimentisphaerales bacterium]|jgi:hypothetical protein